MSKLLIIATSHAQMDASDKPTGLWLEELTTPYYQHIDAGVEVRLASIKGGEVPIDPKSQTTGHYPSVERFFKDPNVIRRQANVKP